TSYYQSEINRLSPYGGKVTFYMTIAGQPNNATMQTWISQGHTVGIHPPFYSPNSYEPYDIQSLSEGYQVYDNWFQNTYSNPPSRTVRNHQVAWLGWTGSASLA